MHKIVWAVAVVACLYPFLVSANPAPLCAQNGEAEIDIKKYNDRGDNYRWVESFLSRLNGFYVYNIELDSIYEEAQKLVMDKASFPELSCVLNGYKDGSLKAEISAYKAKVIEDNKVLVENNERQSLLVIDEIKKSGSALDDCLKTYMTHKDAGPETLACFDKVDTELQSILDNRVQGEDGVEELISLEIDKFNNLSDEKKQSIKKISEKLSAKMFVQRCAFGVCTGDSVAKYLSLLIPADKEVFRKYKENIIKAQVINKAVTGKSAHDSHDLATYDYLGFMDGYGFSLLNTPDNQCKPYGPYTASLMVNGEVVNIGLSRITLPNLPGSYWGVTSISKNYGVGSHTPEYDSYVKALQEKFPDLVTSVFDEDDNTTATFNDDMGIGGTLTLRFSNTERKNFAGNKYSKGCKFEADLKGI